MARMSSWMKHYFFPQMIELQLIGPELTLRMLIEAWCSLQVIELEFKGLDPVARMLFHACHDARFLTTDGCCIPVNQLVLRHR